MKLSPEDHRRLYESLCQAYTQKFDLEQMVRYGLNEKLDDIVGGETIRQIIFRLIDWAETRGKLDNLLNYVSLDEERVENQELQTTIKDILAKLKDSSLSKRSPLAPLEKGGNDIKVTPSGGNDIKVTPSGGNDIKVTPSGGNHVKVTPSGGNDIKVTPSGGNDIKVTPSGGNDIKVTPSGGNDIKVTPSGGNDIKVTPSGGNDIKVPLTKGDLGGSGSNFTENLPNGVKLEMVAIPAGEFMMGSYESRDEQPIHKVRLKEFYMGKYPITKAQYQAVIGNNYPKFEEQDKPVTSIGWNKASDFCRRRLSEMTGKNYKLPSEAQWEYACRAGSTSKWCFGDDESQLKYYAWYGSWNPFGGAKSVGQKKPNDWGLYDMHGNVWEWCEDHWHDNYENAPTDGSAWIDKNSKCKVLRGGSWGINPYYYCRSASRIDFFAGVNSNDDFGFRVVCVSGRTL